MAPGVEEIDTETDPPHVASERARRQCQREVIGGVSCAVCPATLHRAKRPGGEPPAGHTAWASAGQVTQKFNEIHRKEGDPKEIGCKASQTHTRTILLDPVGVFNLDP